MVVRACTSDTLGPGVRGLQGPSCLTLRASVSYPVKMGCGNLPHRLAVRIGSDVYKVPGSASGM